MSRDLSSAAVAGNGRSSANVRLFPWYKITISQCRGILSTRQLLPQVALKWCLISYNQYNYRFTFINISTSLSIRLSIYPPIHIPICLSACLSVHPHVYLFVYLYIHSSIHTYISPSIHPSIYFDLKCSLCAHGWKHLRKSFSVFSSRFPFLCFSIGTYCVQSLVLYPPTNERIF